MIVIPLRFFDMPNALFLEILAWFTQAFPECYFVLNVMQDTAKHRERGRRFFMVYLCLCVLANFKQICQVFWNFDILATFITGYYEDGNLILEPVKILGPIHKLQPWKIIGWFTQKSAI